MQNKKFIWCLTGEISRWRLTRKGPLLEEEYGMYQLQANVSYLSKD